MAGFKFIGTISGAAALFRRRVVKDTVVLTEGMMCELESGEIDKAASNSALMCGIAVEAVDNTDDGESVTVIINPDAIYEVTDANARNEGATLDLDSGATGLTTSSNVDFIVYKNSTATEPTQVVFARGTHFLTQ